MIDGINKLLTTKLSDVYRLCQFHKRNFVHQKVYKDYCSKKPQPLNTMFPERKTRQTAVNNHKDSCKSNHTTAAFPSSKFSMFAYTCDRQHNYSINNTVIQYTVLIILKHLFTFQTWTFAN